MNTGTCDNARDVSMTEIEGRVLAALRLHLLAPEAVAAAVEAYRIERQRLSREHAKSRGNLERDLGDVTRRIAHLIAAIETGADPKPLAARLDELVAKRHELESLSPARVANEVVSLHPQAANSYRKKVAAIHEALTRGETANPEAVALVRGLITTIRVIPTPRGTPVALEIAGDLAALMISEPSANSVTASAVAGACNSRWRHRRMPIEFKLVG